ncbi:MAG: HEAT repeat domain-containing protein [Bacteroidia bacterium]
MNPLLSILLQVHWSDVEYTVDEMSRSVYVFPVHIRVLIGVTMLFILIILVLLGVIMGSRIYKTRRSNKAIELRQKYQPVLRELLFNDSLTENEINKRFDQTDLTTPYHRAILLETILHLHENFTGETADRLAEIYQHLGFTDDSLLKLKSKQWYIVAKGMKELALMNIRTAYKDVAKFQNSKHEILRMESRIAMMKLSEKEPLSFLSSQTEPLTDWDIANIYTMLTRMPENMIPDFTTWLNSPNKDVINFCVQMIGRFRQHEAINTLVLLLKTQDERLKLAVIRAIKALSASGAEQNLIDMYALETIPVKNEILRTLEVIGTPQSLPLLEKVIKQPIEDYPLSIQAVRSLMALGEKGIKLVDQIFTQGGPQLQLVIRHAKDKRL